MTPRQAVTFVQTLPETIPHPARLSFIGIWGTTLVLAILYGICVNQTVMNIVERKNIDSEMALLESRVSDLEFDFIAKKNEITLDFAYAKGYIDTIDTHYVARSDDGTRLSLRSASYEEIY